MHAVIDLRVPDKALLERASNDNAESIAAKLGTYHAQSRVIFDHYSSWDLDGRYTGIVHKIDQDQVSNLFRRCVFVQTLMPCVQTPTLFRVQSTDDLWPIIKTSLGL